MIQLANLQPALRALAEAAGAGPFLDNGYHPGGIWRTKNPGPGWPVIPGADGTLRTGDVGLVETWILKAGLRFSGEDANEKQYSFAIQGWIPIGAVWATVAECQADTLPAALAAAVVAWAEAQDG